MDIIHGPLGEVHKKGDTPVALGHLRAIESSAPEEARGILDGHADSGPASVPHLPLGHEIVRTVFPHQKVRAERDGCGSLKIGHIEKLAFRILESYGPHELEPSLIGIVVIPIIGYVREYHRFPIKGLVRSRIPGMPQDRFYAI